MNTATPIVLGLGPEFSSDPAGDGPVSSNDTEMGRTPVAQGNEEMLRNMNEKIDNMWSVIREMNEEMKKQSELFKNGLVRLEKKFDNAFLMNVKQKAETDYQDGCVKSPVLSVHSTDVVTEVKEDATETADVVEQKVNSCSDEGDGVLEAEDVKKEGFGLSDSAENFFKGSLVPTVEQLMTTDVLTEVKEEANETTNVVEQEVKSCTEATDVVVEAKDVKQEGFELCDSAENVVKGSQLPTVEELRNRFWWIVQTQCERWAFSCIICGGRFFRSTKHLERHDKGTPHCSGLLSCNTFSKLKGYVAAEKKRLTKELDLDENDVFFRFRKDDAVGPSLDAAMRKSSFW